MDKSGAAWMLFAIFNLIGWAGLIYLFITRSRGK